MAFTVEKYKDRIVIDQFDIPLSKFDKLVYYLSFFVYLGYYVLLVIIYDDIPTYSFDETLIRTIYFLLPLFSIITFFIFLLVIRVLSTKYSTFEKSQISIWLFSLLVISEVFSLNFIFSSENDYLSVTFDLLVIISILTFFTGRIFITNALKQQGIKTTISSSEIGYISIFPIIGWSSPKVKQFQFSSQLYYAYSISGLNNSLFSGYGYIPEDRIATGKRINREGAFNLDIIFTQGTLDNMKYLRIVQEETLDVLEEITVELTNIHPATYYSREIGNIEGSA